MMMSIVEMEVTSIPISLLLQWEMHRHRVCKEKRKGKVRVLVIALLTTRSAALLQSQKWQLIGMS